MTDRIAEPWSVFLREVARIYKLDAPEPANFLGGVERHRPAFETAVAELEREVARIPQLLSDTADLLIAARAVRDDMKLRADIGTADGDHDIQMSDGVWQKFNEAIDALAAEPQREQAEPWEACSGESDCLDADQCGEAGECLRPHMLKPKPEAF